MSRGAGLGVYASFVLHVGQGSRTRVFVMPERDCVSASLDGDGTNVSLIVDRDGIALLETLLSEARAKLDAGQDAMAAAIDAESATAAERLTA